MKYTVSTLTGAALDVAVAICNGLELDDENKPIWFDGDCDDRADVYSPSELWQHGGPIIELERITLDYDTEGGGLQAWRAEAWNDNGNSYADEFGSTILIAAMRCYVASKHGETIELPEGLVP